VTKQNDVIRRLQSDIHQVERAADESLRRTRNEAEKQEAAEQKNCEGKLAKQQQELAQVRAQYATVLATHRSGEQALRKVGYPIYRVHRPVFENTYFTFFQISKDMTFYVFLK